MLTIRAVPSRRHDPALQNFVYKGDADRATREKDQALVARIARGVRRIVAPERLNTTR